MSDSLLTDLEIARRILRADRMRPPPPMVTPITVPTGDLFAPGMTVVTGPACAVVVEHLRDVARSHGHLVGDWEPLGVGPSKPPRTRPRTRVVFVSLEAPEGVLRGTLTNQLHELATSLVSKGERGGATYVVTLPPKFSKALYSDYFKYGSNVRIETITATSAYILAPGLSRYYCTLQDGVWTRGVNPETHTKGVKTRYADPDTQGVDFHHDDLSDIG